MKNKSKMQIWLTWELQKEQASTLILKAALEEKPGMIQGSDF